jgi:MFS transporter, DHA2 family, multidrug resistance protein
VLSDQRPSRPSRDGTDRADPAGVRSSGRGAPAAQQQAGGFDLVGFVLVATFLGTLEIMLDRGLIDDWFASGFIVAVAAVCATAFVLMIPWEISRRNPMIDIRMVATRQFGACFLVMLATGAILLSTTQFLPQLVQQNFGWTATWAGLVLSPGGLVTMAMMFVVGRLSAKVQLGGPAPVGH